MTSVWETQPHGDTQTHRHTPCGSDSDCGVSELGVCVVCSVGLGRGG